ncbi:hypothetical protein [Sorangium sp. So ce1078]|uniref:hypothetical protein n=1 Tax=Sorangium sp. So ce1078 TaxID=3133329 RepID=UPI003F615608
MNESRKIVVLLAASLSTAIAGCMGETDEGDGEDLSSVAAPADAEESVGEAPAAQHCHHCPPGSTYVAVVDTCVTEPARFDYTPWAYGCRHGAIVTGRGNVICLPTSQCGHVSPPIVAIGGDLPGPQPGGWPPPIAGGGLPDPQLGGWPPPIAGGGLPGPQLGGWPPPATGLGAPGSPAPLGPLP